MRLDDVIDERTFGGYVETLLPRAAQSGRTLETYLCALLDVVLRSRDQPPMKDAGTLDFSLVMMNGQY